MARLTPTVVMLQFFAFGRVFLEIARMADGKLGVQCLKSGDFSNSRAALTPASIHRISAGAAQSLHLLAFVYDSAFFVAVLLLTVDNAVFFNCSVNSVERNL
jgi:hypothetical protein